MLKSYLPAAIDDFSHISLQLFRALDFLPVVLVEALGTLGLRLLLSFFSFHKGGSRPGGALVFNPMKKCGMDPIPPGRRNTDAPREGISVLANWLPPPLSVGAAAVFLVVPDAAGFP
ncbi:MAG TPA: hypothetical protein VIS74_04920 [Chthoniobacterales bacterium]